MDNLLERHRLPKLTQDNLNRSKTSENWISNQKLPTKKNPGSDSFNGEFYKAFKKLKPIPHKHFQKNRRGKNTSQFILWGRTTLTPQPDKYIKRKL